MKARGEAVGHSNCLKSAMVTVRRGLSPSLRTPDAIVPAHVHYQQSYRICSPYTTILPTLRGPLTRSLLVGPLVSHPVGHAIRPELRMEVDLDCVWREGICRQTRVCMSAGQGLTGSRSVVHSHFGYVHRHGSTSAAAAAAAVAMSELSGAHHAE